MDAATSIETKRLALQTELDAAKSQKERNKLGQFATPTMLAADVLAYARSLLPEDEDVRFLDPALGTGSFYSALLQEFVDRSISTAQGFEIDPHYGEPAREIWKKHPLDIQLQDFTAAKAPEKGFNLVICNPPYVRHHHMDKEAKARLLAATATSCGIKMAGLSGLYCYFLGLSHDWMQEDGIAGWLIPSEFMDVNYGVPVKRYLTSQVELIRIHRFDPNDLQFGDALVSSAVVWFRKRKPAKTHKVEFSFGGTLAKPSTTRKVPLSALECSAKWTSIAADGVRIANEGAKLADFFHIKRGLATGDNSFFILTPEQIAEHDLPKKFFRPILPGPRYLETDTVEALPDGSPRIEKRLFMLDCRLPEEEVRAKHPALWRYLERGKATVAETYLCSRRTPWYAQETRPAAPIICTYMGRNMAKRDKPFRFILNQSQATAANVYLLLYPKPTMAKALGDNPSLVRDVWKFLNSIEASTLLGEGRVYGGGLYKMEPKELANVPAESILAMMPSGPSGIFTQADMFKEKAA